MQGKGEPYILHLKTLIKILLYIELYINFRKKSKNIFDTLKYILRGYQSLCYKRNDK